MSGTGIAKTALLSGMAAFALTAGFGCASGSGGGGGASTATAQPAVPITGALAKIELGMTDTDVRRLLGDPTSSNSYMTGKQFIPFYYGPDASRIDWVYEGVGRVVFSRNRYSNGLKVIRLLPEGSQ